jgi:hypothetical protein
MARQNPGLARRVVNAHQAEMDRHFADPNVPDIRQVETVELPYTCSTPFIDPHTLNLCAVTALQNHTVFMCKRVAPGGDSTIPEYLTITGFLWADLHKTPVKSRSSRKPDMMADDGTPPSPPPEEHARGSPMDHSGFARGSPKRKMY